MQPLYIGPQELGVQRNLKPFMLPNEAFTDLENMYLFRGRITKKRGYTTLGRLRRDLNTAALGNISTVGAGTFTFNLFTLLGLLATEPNAQIVPGNISNIDISIGPQDLIDTLGTGTLAIVGAGNISAASLNYATGVLTITTTAALGPFASFFTGSYYPGLPVMAILQRELAAINSEQRIIFDMKYAYQYTGVFSELPSTMPVTWSGTDSDFFWGSNYWVDSANNNLFWETNFVPGLHGYAVTLFGGAAGGPPSTVNVTAAGNTFQVGDVVYFLNLTGAGAANNLKFGTVTVAGNPFTISNPATGYFANGAVTGFAVCPNVNIAGNDGIKNYNGTTWQNYNPAIDGVTALLGALMIFPYKGRLLFLSTIEGNQTNPTGTNFYQRARWAQIGNPLDLTLSMRSDIVGRGGFIDAPTNERIISAGFLKDDLIVYFERSTWKLVYTGNEVLPFQWQKINTELGAESTFSFVNFDNGLVAFGNVGLHTTNGISVERIDQDIPDTVFNISNLNQGPKRVHGIRDYYLQLSYWAYNEFEESEDTYDMTYPNKILVHNYIDNTFSFFNESFTCFGYWNVFATYTWATLPYPSWASWSDPWSSGATQKDFPSVAAGNQQGYVVQLQTESTSVTQTRSITAIANNVITSPNHNIFINDVIYVTGCIGNTDFNGQALLVIAADVNTITVDLGSAGTYLGGGEFSLLPNINVSTKMFNPFWDFSRRYRLKYAEYLFDRTDFGQVVGNIYINTMNTGSMNDPFEVENSGLLGDNTILTRYEDLYRDQQLRQTAIWHRQYYTVEGETFQIVITQSVEQMKDPTIAQSDVVLHGMIFHFEPAGTFI